jgi:hypothetical protein
MRKVIIILLFIPLMCKAETISESIATLFLKGIEFYSENKTTIDSVYQEVKPILTAAPEDRRQLIIKTIKENEKDLLSTIGTLCADTAIVSGTKESRSSNRTKSDTKSGL